MGYCQSQNSDEQRQPGTIKKSYKFDPRELIARVEVELFCESEERKQKEEKERNDDRT